MRTSRGTRPALVLAGLAAWAVAVPWLATALGLGLDVPARLEVVDHVVPGVVVVACAGILARWRRGEPGAGLGRLGACAVACLAGLWITATHLTLVPEAVDGVTAWGPALLHLSAGPPIAALALWTLFSEP